MKAKKQDPRAYIAMRMLADIFLRSTTKFSSTAKLPKLTQVDQRLKERALASIKSKTPQNKKININKVSQLGSSPLFQGLDLIPDKNKKLSGNQQRHRQSHNQSLQKAEKYRYEAQYKNEDDSKEKQLPISQKRPLQRQHNRNPENELNSSRNLGEQKQVKGNIVSQNLHRHQKEIKDDFQIGQKSMDKRRKYSNENNKSLVSEKKIMTQSRAKSSPKQKKSVSFITQKPQQKSIQIKNQPILDKPDKNQKVGNQKQPYVYVPPKKRTKQEAFFELPIQSQTQLPKVQFSTQKKIQTQAINTSIIRATSPRNIEPVIQRTPRPIQKIPIYRPNVPQKNATEIKKINQTTSPINPNSQNSFVSVNKSVVNKSLNNNDTSRNASPKKRVEFTVQEMRQDWSKIKQDLKYDNSVGPSKISKQNVSQRQDIALKMIAQLFLDASTRYFPGLSMLLRRGISKEQIEQIRSKSSQFKINIFGVERKSPIKDQPKTERKLNWREKQSRNKRYQKQDNETSKVDVTFGQNKSKNLSQIKETQNSLIEDASRPQSKIVEASKISNKVGIDVKKSQKKITAESQFNYQKNQKNSHKNLNQITESLSIYQKKGQKQVQKPNKQISKITNETKIINNQTNVIKKKSNYVYQPPLKKQQEKIIDSPQQKTKKLQTFKNISNKAIASTNLSKTSIDSPQTTQKVIKKPLNQKEQQQNVSQQQLIKSKSQTSILNIKNVNSGQNTIKKQQIQPKQNTINSLIKPITPSANTNKKNQQISSPKNSIIIESKSQKSFINNSEQNKKNAIQEKKTQQKSSTYVYQPLKKKDSSSSYVYQPPNTNQKDNNITTKKQLPSSYQNQNTLRTVKSQKNIKGPISTSLNVKQSNNIGIKEQKNVIESPKAKNDHIKKLQKTSQQTDEPKPVKLLTKKLIPLFVMILTKRLNSNVSNSFTKLLLHSKKQQEKKRIASHFAHAVTTFTKNYNFMSIRQGFTKIKNKLVEQMNKNRATKKFLQEKNRYVEERKENMARIILLILKNKVSSYFDSIKKRSQNYEKKIKAIEKIGDIFERVTKNKSRCLIEEGVKKTKKYSTLKKISLERMSNVIGKFKHSLISSSFNTIVNRFVKQISSNVSKAKSSNPILVKSSNPILAKSKSQQVITSSRSLKQSTQISSPILSPEEQKKITLKQKQFDRKINDLQKKKQDIQQEINSLNKQKRNKTKTNADIKAKIKQIQKELTNPGSNKALPKQKPKENTLQQSELVPILTRIYAYLFEDSTTEIQIQKFLSENHHCFQLLTNTSLFDEWKIINRNAELKCLIKGYEGQQPREKQISEFLREESQLMKRLLRSFVRERYIWEWVNIIARQ